MPAEATFILALVASATVAAIGIAVVSRGSRADRPAKAGRRPSKARPVPAQESNPTAIRAPNRPETSAHTPSVVSDALEPLIEKIQVSRTAYNTTRRAFLNRAALTFFGVGFLGSTTASILAFLWPKIGGGFGSRIAAGSLEDLRTAALLPDGSVVPVFVPSAQTYVVPFLGDAEESQFGESSGATLIVGKQNGEPGLMALWQRCVHLGCRVPQCVPSQGFECPCHGSKYNFHGEYVEGPAPRNLDRFAVEIDANGALVIDTGTIIQTPRAKHKTAAYPQGPTCF